jgi:poly(3-hydroxybutyrate) depolymerase
MKSVSVSGNRLVDEFGNPVQLRGVNRMSTEYACIQGWGLLGEPATSEEIGKTLDAMMTAWHVNTVRVLLNEDCWLNRDTAELDPVNIGDNYRNGIAGYVNEITSRGMVAILDLHWSAPTGIQAIDQQPMPDADNSIEFWTSVASLFQGNPLVIFDLFNEPYPDRDQPPPIDAWDIWLNGGELHIGNPPDPSASTYMAVGMQSLVDAVRSTGATNPIMLGGLDYADDLEGMLDHLPNDPAAQLVASWHVYPNNSHGLDKPDTWDAVAKIMAVMPVVAGEFGRNDCVGADLEKFMSWMDGHGGSYIAWVWNTAKWNCPDPRYELINDYDTGDPATPAATVIRNHYLMPTTLSYVVEVRSIESSGVTRPFVLARPELGSTAGLPLVIVLHGDDGTGAGIRDALPIESHLAAVYAYPDAPEGTFNYYTVPGRQAEAQFVQDLIAALQAEFGINTGRVFVAGMSGGATMANVLGCYLGPHVIRGLGIHSGTLYPIDEDFKYTATGGVSCPLPDVRFVWGAADAGDGTTYAEGQAVRDNYRATQECAGTTTPVSPDPCVAYDGCTRAVEWCAIDGLPHAIWDGAAGAFATFFGGLS